MKLYPWNFKLFWDGIEWGQSDATLGTDNYFYYCKVSWNDAATRAAYRDYKDDTWFRKLFGWQTFGLHKFWHDGPHAQLNLYYLTFYWSTQWTTIPKDFWN